MTFASAGAAEAAFYAAFQARDIDAMMAVWAPNEVIECIHPMGGRLRGRHAVQRSWREIFSSGARLHIEFSRHEVIVDGATVVHIVEERITIGGATPKISTVLATNIYRRFAESWYLAVHHASPSPQPQRAAQPRTREKLH